MDNPLVVAPPVTTNTSVVRSKTTLYIVLFSVCLISVAIGYVYFTNKNKQEKKAREQASKVKALQVKVKSELKAAAGVLKEANELKAKANFERKQAEIRSSEARAAQQKADASGKANDERLSAEKAGLAREAAANVAAANAAAATAGESAKAKAMKAMEISNSLKLAEAKRALKSNANDQRAKEKVAQMKRRVEQMKRKAKAAMKRGSKKMGRKVKISTRKKRTNLNQIRNMMRRLGRKRGKAGRACRKFGRSSPSAVRCYSKFLSRGGTKKRRKGGKMKMKRGGNRVRKPFGNMKMRRRRGGGRKVRKPYKPAAPKVSWNFGSSKSKGKAKSKAKSKGRVLSHPGEPSVFSTLAKGYFDYHDRTNMSHRSTRSDKRLKNDIVKIGNIDEINVYSWTWNDIATSKYGLSGNEVGVIAQELTRDVVGTDSHGYFYIKPGTWADKMIKEIRLKYK
jgi:hypothetical protein